MSSRLSFDIFCRVIDNYGDIGVCWRLARQLAAEHRAAVRLWVDDLASLRMLCTQVDPGSARQHAAGVEIRRWQQAFPAVAPADVAVEAFGCGLPDAYVSAMAARAAPPLWIVLEYLSAESWVGSHHGLPSPHPRLPLQRYFFFPGVAQGTGGVLRESGLCAQRDAFDADARRRFWQSAGFGLPAADATVISMFAYDHAPVAALLHAWSQASSPVVAAIPAGRLAASILEFLGASAAPVGSTLRRASLEVRLLPFVEQPRYDELLWSCDCNFVRGEDSFVRAQWAARPLVWHIYPQQQDAHWRKLEAFMDLYCEGLPAAAAGVLRGMWRAWNTPQAPSPTVAACWRAFEQHRVMLAAHAATWAGRLAEVGDVAGKLALFCRDRLK